MNDNLSPILDPQPSAPAPLPLPLPRVPVVVRPATLDDVPFMDALQKRHARQVGWMPRKQLEAKVAMGQVLVAESDGGAERRSDEGEPGDAPFASPSVAPSLRPSVAPSPVGYCIASDRYFKRDDVGIIYQMNVAPGRQRGLVGATLLKAVFERAAYGCKLFCCWCAQDIEANRFWEAMGFVPLAYRAGGRGKGKDGDEGAERRSDEGCGGAAFPPFVAPSLRRSAPSSRVHIFWQKRIHSGDVSTPWWFPAKTDAGAMREDRLVLPIPPGRHWADEMPVLLPGRSVVSGQLSVVEEKKAAAAGPARRAAAGGAKGAAQVAAPRGRPRVQFGPPPARPVAEPTPPAEAAPAAKAAKPPREKVKADPKLAAAARELRDRYLEHLNRGDGPLAIAAAAAKYDVGRRQIAGPVAARPAALIADARAA